MTETVTNGPATDLTTCDREPIHIPGRVQPHGVLLVLEQTTGLILQVSDNCSRLLGREINSVTGSQLSEILEGKSAIDFERHLHSEYTDANPSYVGTVQIRRAGLETANASGQTSGGFHAILHRFKGRAILELEPARDDDPVSFQNLYSVARMAIGRLKGAATVSELYVMTAEEIRRITRFDRVMIYRFDSDWNGTVVAEAKVDEWHSYHDLRFPASDIPRQARELYLMNRLRLISDVQATPSQLTPALDPLTGGSTDLSYAGLRSVSPIHIEYLKNMGVGASMSVSIVKQDRLWGLIACHHRSATRIPYEVRAACEQLAEIFALQLAAKEYAEGADYRIELKEVQSRLLGQMSAHDNFVVGLMHDQDLLLRLADAAGCAVEIDGLLHLVGQTPTDIQVHALLEWMRSAHDDLDIYHTEELSAVYPPAGEFLQKASGALALALPRFQRSFVVWFRPELPLTLKWAGNPTKAVAEIDVAGRLHPRTSFETWKQLVHGRSAPWRPEEIQAVTDLRVALVGIILRKAEELRSLNIELQRSNRELEAFSYSVSHDLRAPFRHISGFTDLLQKRIAGVLDDTSRRYINTIIESAQFAGTLVDSLLAFSQMGRTALSPREINMNNLVAEVRRDLVGETEGRTIEWMVAPLPVVRADFMMLKLAIRNLLSNAVKYTRKRDIAHIEIGTRDERGSDTFWVRDNGVGFDMRFKDKLFGVFQRLHRIEDFEGTGIGLANVRRTIERHGGRVWAEGKLGEGATFYFTIPRRKEGT